MFKHFIGDVNTESELPHSEAHAESTSFATQINEVIDLENNASSAVVNLLVNCSNVEVCVLDKSALGSCSTPGFESSRPKAKRTLQLRMLILTECYTYSPMTSPTLNSVL